MTERNVEANKSTPFVMFRTKQELELAEEQKQIEFTPEVKAALDKHKLSDVLGARVTVNSPPKVVDVTPVTTAEEFLKLAF